MLARLLRWLLLAQILTGALLAWLVGYASGFTSPAALRVFVLGQPPGIPVLPVHGHICNHGVWDDLATAR